MAVKILKAVLNSPTLIQVSFRHLSASLLAKEKAISVKRIATTPSDLAYCSGSIEGVIITPTVAEHYRSRSLFLA